jgi:hypothetical protein
LCDLFLYNQSNQDSKNYNELDGVSEGSVFSDNNLVVQCDESHAKIEVNEQVDSAKKNKKSTSWRKDVVYKTILRKIRKEYLNEFNTRTKYILTKRSRKPTYLLEKLEEYALFL